jgi:chromosome segregation ATPase
MPADLWDADSVDVPDNPDRNDLHATTVAMLEAADASPLTPAGLTPIALRDGKRTAPVQALLSARRIKHVEFGAPYQDKAALPGQSYHEYGLAIDVIHENAAALKKALEEAGFKQLAAEAWHFTASASSHVAAVNQRRAELKPRSDRFATDLRKSFKARQKLIPLQEALDKEAVNAKVVQASIKLLDADLKAANKELAQLNKQAAALEDAALKADLAVQSAKLKLNSHLKSTCPEGKLYDFCVAHPEWKKQFMVTKKAIEKQVKSMEADFVAKQAKHQAVKAQADAKQKGFDALTAQKKAKAIELAKATQKVTKLTADIEKIEDSRQTINADLAALIAEIDAQLAM